MFLPKIMIDRYGWPGFLVFAVPNLIGCTAFGYVLARRQRSIELAQRHRGAMAVFSFVVVAYHMFFLPFVFGAFISGDPGWGGVAAAVVIFGVGVAGTVLGDRAWLVIAAAVYLFSLVAFGAIGFGAWTALTAASPTAIDELAWMTPVVCIGFLLCPYLDPTFHRALQQSPSPHAFGVFGATFAVMIIFTCFLWFAPGERLPMIAVAHILAQSMFTVGAHLRELRAMRLVATTPSAAGLMLAPLPVALVYPIVRSFGFDAAYGESVYIRFLVFFALLYPAYVLLFIGPGALGRMSGRSHVLLVVVVLLMAPLYEFGFIHRMAWTLVIPAAIAVVWIVVRSKRSASVSHNT
jgi:hypothetical protein